MIRTLDPLVPNEVRYQAALHSDPVEHREARAGNRRGAAPSMWRVLAPLFLPRKPPSRTSAKKVCQCSTICRRAVDKSLTASPVSRNAALRIMWMCGRCLTGRLAPAPGLRHTARLRRGHTPLVPHSGASPSGKASVFGTDIRRFESSRPSHPSSLILPKARRKTAPVST